ncbi:MAG: aminotransferase class I/II-fold pyridoxal phosphate-dependent enzyme [Candidatus Thorarchaeota archaeon]|nr:aminotransferase class I/II-fold pyridoxal phosphate-dependent enzyme [Candidatus Thorarchaeota archaeon]
MIRRKRGLSTRSVQGDKTAEPGPAVEPIVQTSTFIFKNQDEMLSAVKGETNKHVYTRWSNPTTTSAEEKISALEGTEDTLALASGMAAISSTIFGFLKSGDKILACDSIYGGTVHLFKEILPANGIEVHFAMLDEFEDCVQDYGTQYQMCYFETPTNPALRIVDIKRVADAAKSNGILSVIDNTFASPINQRPHEMGIDVVIHSATKYLGGHSDIIAGSVSARNNHMKKVRKAAKLLGGTIDPFASFLLDRGIKTLSARMIWHNFNALFLADRLSRDSRVSRVHYPGLPSHPGHSIAKKQMTGFGGILAIDIDGDLETTKQFVDSLELFLNAVSLGGVESLASIPALTTHYGIPTNELEEMSICESTVRLSVGIEDPEDLLHDIRYSLNKSVE